jgi:hypothetical protein
MRGNGSVRDELLTCQKKSEKWHARWRTGAGPEESAPGLCCTSCLEAPCLEAFSNAGPTYSLLGILGM